MNPSLRKTLVGIVVTGLMALGIWWIVPSEE